MIFIPQHKKKKKKSVIEFEGKPQHHFIGVQNEVVRDDTTAQDHISITVRGVKGVASGTYRIAYCPEAKLGHYLSRLKIKRVAIYSAIYDYSNLGNGRCRMTYIPKAGAQIVIGEGSLGPAGRWQRTNVDAHRIAANMRENGGLSKRSRKEESENPCSAKPTIPQI